MADIMQSLTSTDFDTTPSSSQIVGLVDLLGSFHVNRQDQHRASTLRYLHSGYIKEYLPKLYRMDSSGAMSQSLRSDEVSDVLEFV